MFNLDLPTTRRGMPALGQLAPFLEQDNFFNLFDHKMPLVSPRNLPASATNAHGGQPAIVPNTVQVVDLIPTFICPSSPASLSNYWPEFSALGVANPWTLPRTDYAVMRGATPEFLTLVNASLPPNQQFPVVASNCQRDLPGCNNAMLGVPEGVAPWDALVAKSTIKLGEVTDGLSNTICVIEQAGRQNGWFRGRLIPPPTLVVSQPTHWGWTLNSSIVDWNTSNHIRALVGTDVNNPNLQTGGQFLNVYNRENPYSFHSGGVQSVRGDGSVFFISKTPTL